MNCRKKITKTKYGQSDLFSFCYLCMEDGSHVILPNIPIIHAMYVTILVLRGYILKRARAKLDVCVLLMVA